MKLYHIHRENKYDNLFKEGNTIEFGKNDNFLKESLQDISSSFTQVKTLEDGKNIKKYTKFDEALYYPTFENYSRKNQMQLLEMVREYVMLTSTLNRENILEEVRKNKFPELPSRFKCMYLTDEEGLERWLDVLKRNNARFFYEKENPIEIFEVEAKGNRFVSSIKLLPSTGTKLQNMYFDAERYWNPTEYELAHSNCKEYLVEGEVKILRKVK